MRLKARLVCAICGLRTWQSRRGLPEQLAGVDDVQFLGGQPYPHHVLGARLEPRREQSQAGLLLPPDPLVRFAAPLRNVVSFRSVADSVSRLGQSYTQVRARVRAGPRAEKRDARACQPCSGATRARACASDGEERHGSDDAVDQTPRPHRRGIAQVRPISYSTQDSGFQRV